jgi:DNA-binding SARP family transcriptional activator/tetratricopeptide (TPR) repeat protein
MLRLQTLGRLELEGIGAPALSSRRKELVLLAYLARRGPAPLSRARAATLLWDDRDERLARQSLRQALLELRRVVGEGLVVESEAIRLAAGAIELDATQFEREISEGRPEAAVARWRGDFLPGAEDVGGEELRAWMESEREGLRSRFRSASLALIDDAERRGAWREGIAHAERWADALPLDQAAHARLFRLMELDGQAQEAVARLAEMESRLRAIELEPTPELTALRRTLEQSAATHRASPRTSAALREPEMVGRGPALAELEAAWDAARRGESAVVVVEGEPGIGKTRLSGEFLRRLARVQPRATILETAAIAAASGGFQVELAEVLADAPGLAGTPAPALVRLAEISPSIRARFPALPSRSDVPPGDAFREALGAVAGEAPVVLLIEDFPRADSESVRILLELMAQPPAGVLLLATARTGEATGLSLPPPGVRRLKLQPLSPPEVERLIDSVVPLEPEDRRHLAARLFEHTGGNPWFLVELMSALADEGGLAPAERGVWRLADRAGRLPVPVRVREVLTRRVAGLTPAARSVLEAAAVLDLPFDRTLLAEVAGDSPVAVEAGLEELATQRLVRESGGSGNYRIATDLLRRHVEQGVEVARGEALSSRAIAALERRPADAALAAALAHHRSRAAALTAIGRRRQRRVAAAAGVALCLALAAALVTRSAAPPIREAIAVLPFAVSGAPELSYLREGIVTLLSVELDGAGSLRAVDPRAIIGIAGQLDSVPPDAERGRRVADKAGAGMYVIGDIVQAGDRIRIDATAYGEGNPARVLARAQAEGTTGGLFELVDAVAGQLLGGLSAGPYEQLTRVAATTTHSLPALKDYLEGEQLFRGGEFHQAARAFQRASAEDTTFALAYYWYSVASWWADDSQAIDSAATQAVRYGSRLAGRDRRLFEAWATFLRGDAVEAERVYRRLVALEPENVEGWLQLGEVLFHSGPRRGRPVGEARPAFERALFFEPEHTSALLHLARIAASEGRWADLDSLARRILRLNPTGEWAVEVRALRSFAGHDQAEQARVIAELRTSVEGRVWNTARYVAVAAHNLTGAARIVSLLTEPTRPPEVRAFGHQALAYLDVATGRLAAAADELDRAAALDPAPSLEHRALLALLPTKTPADPDLTALRDSVARLIVPTVVRSLETSHLANLHEGVELEVQSYLLGSLSVELADGAATGAEIRELERPRAGAEAAAVAHDAAGSIRARQAQLAGNPAEAARQLAEVLRLEGRVGLIGGSPFYSQGLERFRYAQVLERLGRTDEAARWYDSFSSNSIFDLALLPAAELERARMEERLGRRPEASRCYRRVVELWSDGDAAVQPMVAEARAGWARTDEGTPKATGSTEVKRGA